MNGHGIATKCPLCGLDAETSAVQTRDGSSIFQCPRCGHFGISEELKRTFYIDPKITLFVSAATRQATAKGNHITLNPRNLNQLASSHHSTRITEKREKLLKHIANLCGSPGGVCTISVDFDYPLIDAKGPVELTAFLKDVARREVRTTTKTGVGSPVQCELTIDGWEAVELRSASGGIPGRCFVATWLDDSMDDVYRSGIQPAITDCAFEAIWMKDVETNQGITDRILAEIRLAEFVVADFTGQRQSVYFEAGFARGLGRQVIWTCRKDEIDNLHFDTKHLGHIAWADADDLRTRLTNSIRANIIKPA